jgi:hypothetical protein
MLRSYCRICKVEGEKSDSWRRINAARPKTPSNNFIKALVAMLLSVEIWRCG